MGFIIFGIIVLVVGAILSRVNDVLHKFGKPVRFAGGILIVIGLLSA